MDWSRIERNWDHYKADVMARWPLLSEQQVEATKGNHDQLSSCVQRAYGLGKPEADRRIAVWCRRQAPRGQEQ